MHKFVIALIALALLTPLQAQQVCPCVPIAYEWVAVPCDSWNCAASAVLLANGANVVPLPTTSNDFTWVVLKRMAVGSATISPDAPFKVDGFDGLTEASARFFTIDHQLQPMLITVPDGKVLVIARTSPEKSRSRVVSH